MLHALPACPGRVYMQAPSEELGHGDLLIFIFAALSTVVSKAPGCAIVTVERKDSVHPLYKALKILPQKVPTGSFKYAEQAY